MCCMKNVTHTFTWNRLSCSCRSQYSKMLQCNIKTGMAIMNGIFNVDFLKRNAFHSCYDSGFGNVLYKDSGKCFFQGTSESPGQKFKNSVRMLCHIQCSNSKLSISTVVAIYFPVSILL